MTIVERTQQGSQLRIAAKGHLLVAVPVLLALGWAGFTVYLNAAIPADQRHLGIVPFFLVGEGSIAVLALTLYLSLWRPASRDVIEADDSGLRLTSRRHGDRELAWSEIAELGWMPGVNSQSGLIGKLQRADSLPDGGRPMWLCNPAGRRWPPELGALQALAQQHGVAWNSAYASIDIDSGLPHAPWWRRIIGRR